MLKGNRAVAQSDLYVFKSVEGEESLQEGDTSNNLRSVEEWSSLCKGPEVGSLPLTCVPARPVFHC